LELDDELDDDVPLEFVFELEPKLLAEVVTN
jgi:hypothetical protein